MEKCGVCGNMILKYDKDLLCIKCDADEIAKRARESHDRQIKKAVKE